MKKRMTAIVVLIIGIGCWFSEAVVMAEESDDENRSIDFRLEDYLDKNSLKGKDDISSVSEDLLGVGGEHSFEQPRNMFDIEEKKTAEKDSDVKRDKKDEKKESEELAETKDSAGDETVVSEMKSLQIPQKLDVVIDPWEMDGKGQIYSEEYVIRNGGDTAGTLILSNLACKTQESGKVIVRSDNDGLHDNEEKSIYMEMWFGDSDLIVLSEQEAEYRAVLKPAEELTIHFAGEVNEYASENWISDDVRVSVVYSWETEEPMEDENEEDKDTEKSEENEIEKALIDTSASDKEKTDDEFVRAEDLEEVGKNEEAKESQNSKENEELKEPVEDVEDDEENIFYIDGDVRIDDGIIQEEIEEDRIKVIELSEEQMTKAAVVDSWKVKQDYQITSIKYLIQNVGERAGIFSLTDLVCQPKEECGINVKTIREEVQDTDEKAIYMELVLGNGEKFVLTQTGSECKVELRPGEDMIIQFVGVMNVDMSEDWKEDSVVIRAGCSWETEK